MICGVFNPVIVRGGDGVWTLDVSHKATTVGAPCMRLILNGVHGVGVGNSCNRVWSVSSDSPKRGTPKLVATLLFWTGDDPLLAIPFVSARVVMATTIKAPSSRTRGHGAVGSPWVR